MMNEEIAHGMVCFFHQKKHFYLIFVVDSRGKRRAKRWYTAVETNVQQVSSSILLISVWAEKFSDKIICTRECVDKIMCKNSKI
jgi:hypothetical protein